MKKFLPIAWLIFIPVSLAFAVFIQNPTERFLEPRFLFAKGTGLLISALFYGAFATIYAVFARVSDRKLVFRLGWAHLGFLVLSIVASTYFYYLRYLQRTTDYTMQRSEVILTSGLNTTCIFLAALSFLAASLAALTDVRKRIEPKAFD
ncbi:MAG: hypothetical protein AAGJ68_12235 [Pseudomonadota bacterium]